MADTTAMGSGGLRKARRPWRFAAVIVALGVLIAAGGLNERARNQPINGGVRTTGVVVSVGSDGKTWTPTIRFISADGRPVEFAGTETFDEPRLGMSVPVSYALNNPAGAHEVNEPGNAWIVAVIGGLALTAFGSWSIWNGRRQQAWTAT